MALQRLETKIVLNEQVTKSPNLCDRFSDADLATIGKTVWDGFNRDKQSRIKWEQRTQAAMDLAMQVQQDKNFPWPNCSNVVFPLVTIAALQFSSRAYPGLIQGTDVVKYRVVGEDPDKKLSDRADRISKHMSYQILEEDEAWEEQHDRLMINVAIVGCNFIKAYYSSSMNHNVSELVLARDLVLDYWAKSVDACARKTQIIPMYRNEIYENVVTKVFRDCLTDSWFNSAPPTPQIQNLKVDNQKGVTPPAPDEDSPFQFLEQHRFMDLDQDGYAEPYIVTIESSTQKAMKIVARWEREEDIERTDFPGQKSKIRKIRATEYYTKYGFIPAPDGGVYDVGFGVLLGPINDSVSTGINQLLDAGTMANSNGGFLGRGVKIRGGVYTMAPWTWKRVDSTGDDLRKSMVPFPTREPSDVMFKLLGLLINYTDKLAGTTDVMVGENPGQNTPAETSRNMMEQGTKVYAGIFKRIWRSMKREFKQLHQLNALYLPSRARFGASNQQILQEDYKSNPDLVVPAADPNVVSDGQRLVQAQAIRQAAHEVNGYNIENAERNYLKALKVDAIEHFYPGPDKTPPLPNPKLAVEQMKMQISQMKIQADHKKFVMDLMSKQAETQAKIVLIYAQVNKLLAETQTEKVKAKIEAFNAMVGAFETANVMYSNQIKLMQGAQDEEGNGNGKPGTMGGMEGAPGNAGSAGASQASQTRTG